MDLEERLRAIMNAGSVTEALQDPLARGLAAAALALLVLLLFLLPSGAQQEKSKGE